MEVSRVSRCSGKINHPIKKDACNYTDLENQAGEQILSWFTIIEEPCNILEPLGILFPGSVSAWIFDIKTKSEEFYHYNST